MDEGQIAAVCREVRTVWTCCATPPPPIYCIENPYYSCGTVVVITILFSHCQGSTSIGISSQ
jgi:hypothetical protein